MALRLWQDGELDTAPALVTPLEGGAARVDFDTPQRAPAPGQSAVCYDGEFLLGGGFIAKQLTK